jgi:hypothetical protein
MHRDSKQNDIQMRMERIREQSRLHATEVALHSGRMLDWKEHLRSAPFAAFGLSALAGFALLYRRSRSCTSVTPLMARYEPHSDSAHTVSNAAGSIRSMVLSMATSMLLTSGKRALLRGLQSYLAQSNHGYQSNQRRYPSSSESERLNPSPQVSDN